MERLEGGERADARDPPRCGSYSARRIFTPGRQRDAEQRLSKRRRTRRRSKTARVAGLLSFSPVLLAQSTNTQAGAFSPFKLEITRHDQRAGAHGRKRQPAAGIAALLSTVTPCQEPPAGVEWSCGEESQIGQSTAESGFGSEPIALHGQVFLTSGYDGAPFGLLVRTLAAAGPFDLGYVNVRSRINVNPETAAVTITTDPGPRGEVLLDVRSKASRRAQTACRERQPPELRVQPDQLRTPVDRVGRCRGPKAPAPGCPRASRSAAAKSLPFHPDLTATVGGHANKADGTGFDVKITSAGAGAGQYQEGRTAAALPAPLPPEHAATRPAWRPSSRPTRRRARKAR